ncbi:hypothetical protein BO71DRAFT_380277 [Aspergillus ellipticus CBS 707.79]|uniref:F-box domain protein n=1 Tax=Aspergillus ellipticus CBS 707.79 TaxID=1448320 RepID=A0A319D9Q0_9EURO|nr:hypothetical protein BO71DRAFT_380277 [Aspergillus ellipticus CBS 707.79]
MDNFDRAVSAIPRNQLQSFKWDLGTCLPDELVNRIEALLKNQKQINSIALITDSDCKVNRNTSSSIDLVQFSKLESLSWKGLKHYNDFESVRAFISAHGAQLKTLCLDLIGWDSAVLAWRRGFLRNSPQDTGLPDNFFARSVLCLQHGKLIRPFPALKCLTLTQVSFHPMQAEMVNALNVEGLRALQLSNCPGIFSWLRQVLRSGTPLNLKSLELVFNPELANQIIDEAFDNVTDTVTKFLQSFQGLEDLYLMLPQQTDWQAMSEGIAHHSSTLKRLVTHHLDRTEWLGSTDGDLLLKTAELQSPIRSTSLQFYGVSVSTQKLATHQDTFNDCVILSPNVKLLHLRASGSEMSEQTHNEPLLTSQAMKTLYRFAHWAFSSEGSPNLQVLAYGDFSHNNHFSNYNVILCRSGDGYRELDCPDGIYWDLVQDNKDMLAACSCDELIVGRGMPDFT